MAAGPGGYGLIRGREAVDVKRLAPGPPVWGSGSGTRHRVIFKPGFELAGWEGSCGGRPAVRSVRGRDPETADRDWTVPFDDLQLRSAATDLTGP